MSSDILKYIKKLQINDIAEKSWAKERKPIGVTFEITSVCNLRCVHCFLSDLKKCSDELSYEKITQIIDILFENGILFLTLTGGEVFMRKDFRDIYMYAKKKGFLISIFTNGTLIDEDWVRLFNEFPPLLIDLSIYGASRETYRKVTGSPEAFDKFINALELLKKYDLRFALKTPLLSINRNELPEMHKINDKYCKEKLRFSFEIAPDREDDSAPLKYAVNELDAVLQEIDDALNTEGHTNKALDENEWKIAKGKGEFVPAHFCLIANVDFHIDFLGRAAGCIECSDRYSMFEYDLSNIWKKLGEYKRIEARPDYPCVKCEALYYCKSCPQLRRRMYGDAQIIKPKECIMARLKHKYYADNASVEELKCYYKKLVGGGE